MSHERMEPRIEDGMLDSKEALLRGPSIDEWNVDDSTWKRPKSKSWRNKIHLTFLYSMIFVLLAAILTIVLRPQKLHDPSQGIYSPANNAIKYHTVVFPENFATKGPYMGVLNGVPTDETDRLWEDLYQFGVSSISRTEALGLPNRTAAIPNGPEEYVIELDVFHQLHCLNTLRKTLYPERYGPLGAYDDWIGKDRQRKYTSVAAHHYDHCIDSLRQYIMCHSDVATVYWQWKPRERRPVPRLEITHTCRDFEAIKQWALDHQLENDEENLVYELGPEDSFQLSPEK